MEPSLVISQMHDVTYISRHKELLHYLGVVKNGQRELSIKRKINSLSADYCQSCRAIFSISEFKLLLPPAVFCCIFLYYCYYYLEASMKYIS